MSISHLIHANTHRVKEGARVLEDVARFVINDDGLFKKAREIRHSLRVAPVYETNLIDIGASYKEQNLRANLYEVVQANVIRMQEGLRVLEEHARDLEHKQQLKNLRYASYELQQTFHKKLQVFLKQSKLQGVYLIVDPNLIKLPISEIADIINKTSVSIVQFRDKLSNKKDVLNNALVFRKLLDPEKLFIMNDYLDIALDIADGIHLGQDDYPIERIRHFVPDNFVVGVTCHNHNEAQFAVNSGASYLSLGCLFDTKSKLDVTPISLDEVIKIRTHTTLPLCGIGGINLNNLDTILELKLDMLAMISSIWFANDPAQQINFLQKKMKNPAEYYTVPFLKPYKK